MKKAAFILGSIIILLLPAAAFSLTFDEIKANLDPEKNTKVGIKDYWRSVEGKEVEWPGTVMEVKGGARGRYKVYLKVGKAARPNVVMVTDDERAVKLKKGQNIRFSGILANYKRLLGRFTIELTEGVILR